MPDSRTTPRTDRGFSPGPGPRDHAAVARGLSRRLPRRPRGRSGR